MKSACSFSALSWNCEGIKSSIFLLTQTLSILRPSIISLSEPQLFHCDAEKVFKYIKGEYCYFLKSEDLNDPELPLFKSRTFGEQCGRKTLTHIEVYKTDSTYFLPIILRMPSLCNCLEELN